jgi:tripartite-type tricarboxylate transporter receptor subunit TctC
MVDLMAGRIDVMFADVQSYLSARGKVRVLAVGAPRRSSLAPEVPTSDELGLSGFHTGSWTGLLAPARTPAAIVNKLNAALTKGLQQPATMQRFTDLGMEWQILTPQAFGKFVATEIAGTGKLVKKAQIKAE